MNLLLFILLLAAGATGLRAAPNNSTRVPRDVFALRPLEWIPSIPQVRIIPVAFPDAKPMGYIHALATTGERLWISAHPFGDTNLPPTAGRLWTFLPGDNRIDPATGNVTGWIDLKGILPAMDRTGSEDVMNGIAYDAARDRLFVTGKLWSKLYEITLKQRS